MAFKLDLQPVERQIQSFTSSVKSFFTDENLSLIGEKLVDIGIDVGKNYLTSKIEGVFNQLVSEADESLSKLVDRINSVIPMPNVYDLLGLGLSKNEPAKNPFLLQDPNFTGFFFVFISFPVDLTNQGPNLSDLCGFLAKSYNPPSHTISTIVRKGIGNTQLTLPKTHDYDRQFTITFLDTYELAIYQIFETWMSLIADPRSGFHSYDYIDNIKGSVVVVHYTPTMKKQVHIDTYFGVFPTGLSALDQDRSTNSLRETQVTFAFDSI